MSVSQFATYMNPLISALKKLGGSARPEEVCNVIAEDLNLSDDTLEERLKNGISRYENQVHWARYYLAQTGHIDSSRRGVWGLTEKGQNVQHLSEEQLRQIIKEVQAKSVRQPPSEIPPAKKEEIEDAGPPGTDVGNYREELLAIMKSLPPSGFERLCQRLLREAGFEKVIVTGRSGDGGIDGNGVLQLNPFVSFQVLFQCKRYDGSVGAHQIRDFRGAMMGRAEKGIILTTGSFTPESKREAVRDGVPPIELVDGEKMLDMFESLELGLTPRTTYDVDESFFEAFRG